MITGSITAYGVGLFIHVLAAVVAIGATFAYPVFIGIAERHMPESLPAMYKAMMRSDQLLVTPGLVVVLIAGIYLIADAGISMGESWISIGFLAVIMLFGMAHGFFRPRYREALGLAERDRDSGSGLSDEYRAVSKKIERGGQVAALIVAVTIFFMVVKP